mgnify:FL=1
MVEDALQSEQGEKNFRKYLKPLVEEIADKFLNNKRVKELALSRESLVEAGWSRFGIALKKYYEKTHSTDWQNEDPYLFSTYFVWYIRQGMVEYVKSLEG